MNLTTFDAVLIVNFLKSQKDKLKDYYNKNGSTSEQAEIAISDLDYYAHNDNDGKNMINRKKIKQIAEEIEEEWQMCGLSGGIYEDYAYEITKKYIESTTTNKV